ncbi:hypothetical protein PFISCL1PPCAC_8982, partial [Pristionchus fissidentatus]
ITFNDLPSETLSHLCTFLSAGQRRNFGRTCRWIREVELTTPHKKIARITIVWTKESQSVKATLFNGGRFVYSAEGGNDGPPLEVDRDMAMYFHHAFTKELQVEVKC